MIAAPNRRQVLAALGAALFTGAALFFIIRNAPEDEFANKSRRLGTGEVIASGKHTDTDPSRASTATPADTFTPPLQLTDAERLSTADIALQLAGWPEGKIHPDLPKWAALLAARGAGAVNDLSSALATAGSNTARGVLSDALARIGTDNAIQELCSQAVNAPDDTARLTIAASFRALSRPASVPMLATLFSQTDSGPLITEATSALRRLADGGGVQALADLSQEGGQLYSQRGNVFKVLAGLENPDALPALEVLAADTTDPERAKAAAAGAAHLKAVIAGRSSPP